MKDCGQFFTEITKCTGLRNVNELVDNHFLFTKRPFSEYSLEVPVKIALYRVIKELLQSRKKSLLGFGHKLNASSEYGIECIHPNNCVTHILQNYSLQILLIDPNLLIEGILIYMASGGSFTQIWGTPISEFIYGYRYESQKRKETISRLPMLYQRAYLDKHGDVLFYYKGDELIMNELTALFSADDLMRIKVRLRKLHLAKFLNYYCPRQAGYPFICNFTVPSRISAITETMNSKFTRNGKGSCECKYVNVARFLFSIFKFIFGHILVGNPSIWRKRFYSFVALRRNEKFPLNLNGISSLSLLSPAGTTRSSSIARQANLLSFYCFIFRKFLPSLIKSCFYVTESSHRKQRLFYFRHDDWLDITREKKTEIISLLLEPLSRKRKRQKVKLQSVAIGPICKLRLVPKKVQGEFRPIMNMKAINSSAGLKYVLAILNFYRTQYPKLLGSSVMGFDRVKSKIDSFANFSDNRNNPDSYKMVKFDMKACFDNIPHNKMIEVLKEIIVHDGFSIQKVDRIRLIQGKLFKKVEFVAIPNNQIFNENLTKTGCLIINDRSQAQILSKQEVLELLELHITRNIILFEGKLWRQKCGIPQGSILSSILCSIFYGHLDRKCYRQFLKSSQILILRFVDDILIVSKHVPLINEYLNQEVDLSYGFSVNSKKSQFNYGDEGETGEFFEWCGMYISNNDLSIKANFEEEGTSLYDSLTIDYSLSPLEILTRQLMGFTRHKLSPIFINKRYKKSIIEYNVQRNIDVMIKRCNAVQRELKRHAGYVMRPEIVQKLIENISLYIKNKAKSRLLK